MADISSKIDVEKLVSYGDDLVQLLKNDKQINYLKNCVDQFDSIRSRNHSDRAGVQSSLEGYQKKIDMCKQETETIKAEVASDAEIHLLQKELDAELQGETLLQEELRAITSQIKDFEEQRSFIEEKMQALKKLEQYEMKSQAKLSMYASVSSIIPDLNEQFKISGHIVHKEKKVVEKLELNSGVMSDFDTCNAIWKMIN